MTKNKYNLLIFVSIVMRAKKVVYNYFDGTKNKSTGEACTFIFVFFLRDSRFICD